ncbi:MAG TPA: DUF4388 domain-containing protein [Coleofasciculaceae cyanobacterium]
MSLIGSLADFPVLEILQFIEKGKKTGLLTLCPEFTSQESFSSVYYIWVYQGRLVAIANRLDGRGLANLIHQHQWVSPRVITKLAQLCPSNQPLGLYLKNQSVLQASQLKQLFFAQVLQPIGTLVQLKNGLFKFNQNQPFPMQEMTGLSISVELTTFFVPSQTAKTQSSDRRNSAFSTRVAKRSVSVKKVEKNLSNKYIQENELAPVLP